MPSLTNQVNECVRPKTPDLCCKELGILKDSQAKTGSLSRMPHLMCKGDSPKEVKYTDLVKLPWKFFIRQSLNVTQLFGNLMFSAFATVKSQYSHQCCLTEP